MCGLKLLGSEKFVTAVCIFAFHLLILLAFKSWVRYTYIIYIEFNFLTSSYTTTFPANAINNFPKYGTLLYFSQKVKLISLKCDLFPNKLEICNFVPFFELFDFWHRSIRHPPSRK